MHTNLRDHLERMLRERRARLLRSATACETALLAFAEERESELEESAQEEQIDRVLGLLDDRQRREVVEINAALDRIADDTYGMCSRCERPIEIDRLAVMPETDVCLRCASVRETKQAAAAPTGLVRDAKREASRPSGFESVKTDDVFESTETGVAFAPGHPAYRS
jgi:RNA polymerase-binding transcription factor DksA